MAVDLEQHFHRVPGPLYNRRGRTPPLSQVNTEAWRRLYGVLTNDLGGVDAVVTTLDGSSKLCDVVDPEGQLWLLRH
jgi:hypothetical protein